MKICIATSGSRGDVQPYIALGMELVSRGHEVVIATEERMADFVKSYSLPFKRIAGDPTGMIYEKQYQALLAKGQIMPVLKATEKYNRPFYEQTLQDYAAAAQGADMIITAALCITQTLCVSQAMQIPWVPVMLGPVLPTGDFPSWAISATPFRAKWFNRFTYTFLFWALWQSEKAKVNAWRKASLGLPPLRWAPYYAIEAAPGEIPVVMMCSKHIIPGQAVPKDWPSSAHLTGPAFVPDTPTAAIDPALRQFMEAGEDKPVYLGFGSMPAPDPKALLELAVKVVQLTGRRAVLCAGWSDLALLIGSGPNQVQLPEGRLLVVPSAPHDWLLPRCCAAVHHAGVGTCAAALRAGVLSVPCPVMLDQPVNALRLQEAGVATPAISFVKLTAEALSANILAACSNEGMQQKAAAAAAAIAEEYPGVKGAADVVLSAVNPWAKLAGKV